MSLNTIKAFFIGALLLCLSVFTHNSMAQEKNIAASRVVDLEWESVDEAMKYEIEFSRILENNTTKKPAQFFVELPSWRGRLNFGLYKMRLRSYDDRGVPGDWTDSVNLPIKVLAPNLIYPVKQVKLKSGEDTEHQVEFKWKASSGASKYRLDIRSRSGEFKQSALTTETSHTMTLKVSRRYNWKITPIMIDESEGELPDKEESFTLLAKPLDKVVIDKPISKFVKQLKWNTSPRATTYRYSLYFKKGKKWSRVERNYKYTKTEIDFDLSRPTGMYKLIVRPSAPLTERAPLARIQFPVKGGLRTPAAIQEAALRESIEKPKDFYAIASYFITIMDIRGGDSQSLFKMPGTVGGTGRLGIGYQRQDSKYGTFGIIDLSGFNIGTDNYTFASFEAHGTWKKYWGAKQLILSGGIFAKELPVVFDDGNGQFAGVNIHTNIGPHLGFKFWTPLTETLGIQLNGRLYYNVDGQSPDGETISPTTSSQIGLLGTYRLQESLMGFAGYSYRKDTGAYQTPTVAIPDNITEITVEGHYLNFVVEYAF